MEHNAQRDAEQAAITTAEHRSLGNVLDAIRRLEELRSRGLSSAQIAERIRLTHPNRPGGGPWSAEAVNRVLEIADANRSRASTQPTGQPVTRPVPTTPSAPAPATPITPPDRRLTQPGRAADQTARSYPPPAARPTPELDPGFADRPPTEASIDRRDDQRAPLRVEPRRYHRRPSVQPEPASGPGTGRRRPAIAAVLTLVGLVAVGVGLYRVGLVDRFTANDQEAAPAAPTTTDAAAVDEQLTSDGTAADQPTVADEATSAGDEASAETDTDDADSLVIRIEPSTPATNDGIVPASATIRSDGKLYIEGAFRSESEAQRYLELAAGVFGEAALVPGYTIDPAAPDPTVSDVVLEKPVLFERGSAEIDPQYIPFLEACGDVLKMNSHIVMSVTAFTDASGSAEFNLELSQRRADAVIDFYRNLDIGEDQLISTGFGESDFVADNSTEEGRQQNRRAMLELLNVMKES